MDPDAPNRHDNLVQAALKILNQPDPWCKAAWTREVVSMWRAGQIATPGEDTIKDMPPAPGRPARADDKVRLVPSGQVPRLGKGGNLTSRTAIVHSLAHIESWAVDLAWDVIARWGQQIAWTSHLPREFYDDFVNVADDECRHFLMLESRLKAMGSHYGALVAHDGLWESASTTAHSLAARLAVEHCVHEARGLDVLPSTIDKFRKNGDEETAVLLEGTIYPEEVSHCAAGVRWLRHLHSVAHNTPPQAPPAPDSQSSHTAAETYSQSQQPIEPPSNAGELAPSTSEQCGSDKGEEWMSQARRFPLVQDWFHYLVRQHFKGALKPPFNTLARAQAGFDESWYLPLCSGGAPSTRDDTAAATKPASSAPPAAVVA